MSLYFQMDFEMETVLDYEDYEGLPEGLGPLEEVSLTSEQQSEPPAKKRKKHQKRKRKYKKSHLKSVVIPVDNKKDQKKTDEEKKPKEKTATTEKTPEEKKTDEEKKSKEKATTTEKTPEEKKTDGEETSEEKATTTEKTPEEKKTDGEETSEEKKTATAEGAPEEKKLTDGDKRRKEGINNLIPPSFIPNTMIDNNETKMSKVHAEESQLRMTLGGIGILARKRFFAGLESAINQPNPKARFDNVLGLFDHALDYHNSNVMKLYSEDKMKNDK